MILTWFLVMTGVAVAGLFAWRQLDRHLDVAGHLPGLIVGLPKPAVGAAVEQVAIVGVKRDTAVQAILCLLVTFRRDQRDA